MDISNWTSMALMDGVARETAEECDCSKTTRGVSTKVYAVYQWTFCAANWQFWSKIGDPLDQCKSDEKIFGGGARGSCAVL